LQVVPDKAALEEKFKAEAALADQPEIYLRPHAKANYKYVASELASAQRLNVTKIGLVGNEAYVN
jgi:biopolymer transport protein ExbD